MIQVCKPWLPGKEREYVLDAISTSWISGSGKNLEIFEKSFADYCGTKYGVACSNGFAALHLACVALGLKKGDEVIVPTFTMIASVNSIILSGSTPVLVDCESDTYCIDVNKIEEKITNKTKAIMPVHIYGHMSEMNPILDIAKKYNLLVIEDAAEAHGAEYFGKRAGSFSDVACFSFYGNKIITTGEGGMCVTNNYEIAEKMRKLRNHFFSKERFLHYEVGFNYRMTNVQAAIGCAQMENVDKLVEARRNVGLRYNKILAGTAGIILPKERANAKNVFWMYGVVLSEETDLTKGEIMFKLDKMGIETRSFFIPMHKQPAYYNKTIDNAPNCTCNYPVADRIGSRGFYLPSSSDISDEEILQVCNSLKKILSN